MKWSLGIIVVILVCSSCTTTSMIKYYNENKVNLDSIQQVYKKYSAVQPFSLEYLDKNFQHIFLEIVTDSLKYIYEFNVNEPRLKDSLRKYGLPASPVEDLLSRMKLIECRWVSNLDHYIDGRKNTLVFMSVKTKDFRWPFTPQKYYILTYYNQPQYYDAQGRLMDNRTRNRLRKLNGDVFKRVNARVAYTISDRFR